MSDSDQKKEPAVASRDDRRVDDSRDKQDEVEAEKMTNAFPRASVPPRVAPLYGRPVAGSPTQRRKRAHARNGEPAGTITASVNDAGEGEILLFGTIGQDFWGEGVSARGFNDSLVELGNVTTIRLRINSGGGDVFEATAIYSMLVKNIAHIIVEVEGVAASAATIVAMAADEIRIMENAHWMIHRASGAVWGNTDQLRDYMKLLENADELIRLTYGRRTGLDDAKLRTLMDHDNWMTAQEALDLGFVDAIDEANAVKPHIEPESSSNGRPPVQLSQDRLAAMADSLALITIAFNETRVAASATNHRATEVAKPDKEKGTMNEELRSKCVACGMSEDLDDAAAWAWFNDHTKEVLAALPQKPVEKSPAVKEDNKTGITAEEVLALMDARDKRIADQRSDWRKEVDANLTLAFGDQVPKEIQQSCYGLQSDGISAVREHIVEARKVLGDSHDTGGLNIRLSDSQPSDRHLAAIRSGFLVRALRNSSAPDARLQLVNGKWERVPVTVESVVERHLPEAERAADWDQFSRMPLIKIAEECLLAEGVSRDEIRRLSPASIAMAAMGYRRRSGLRAEAVHSTGSLLHITFDAVNKSLLAGYGEAPQTWRGPMRQGASVTDFKDIHRVKLGAAGNLPVWIDNLAPEEAKLANEKESYAVEARAETLKFSWRLIINDDLDALSRRPQLLGDAAGRTVNAVAWARLTANPDLSDGKALLLATPAGNRKRSNLTTGSATPTNTTIGAMRSKMRLMRGLNTPEGVESEDILNLDPAFIAAPTALEELILKQVLSGSDPAASGNSNVFNTARTLTPVIEPLLDANSATAWYLFASPTRVDTIEVTFMEGYETPVPHEWVDDETMSQNFSIIQVFNAAALDYRGVQRHDGA